MNNQCKSMMKLNSIIILYLILLSSFILLGCDNDKQNKKPNIILFLADDLGYGDLQCYNSKSKIPTPNINELAKDGMLFSDAHASSSVCTPTRYGLLTGRYSWRTDLKEGVLGLYSEPLIETERLTLPKMLKEQGYNTACFGKWHLGMEWGTKNNESLPKLLDRNYDISVIDHKKEIKGGPLTAGFDYYYGVDVPNYPPYCFIENNKVVDIPTIPKPETMYGHDGLMVPNWKLEDVLPTITEKAISFINNLSENSKKEKPFFMYFSSTAPHAPILPAKQYQGKSKAGPYGDLVVQVDDIVGQIKEALENKDLAKNTIFIFTSDNGSPAVAGDSYTHGKDFKGFGSLMKKFGHDPNFPLRGMKADSWEGGHRVPFIVKWPNHINEGKISSDLVSTIDVMATIASIVNYPISNGRIEDSFDMKKNLLNEEENAPVRSSLIHHSGRGGFSIRKGKWKLINHLGSFGKSQPRYVEHEKGKPEGQLYDMVNDPKETKNMWSEYPEVVEHLLSNLNEIKIQKYE